MDMEWVGIPGPKSFGRLELPFTDLDPLAKTGPDKRNSK